MLVGAFSGSREPPIPDNKTQSLLKHVNAYAFDVWAISSRNTIREWHHLEAEFPDKATGIGGSTVGGYAAGAGEQKYLREMLHWYIMTAQPAEFPYATYSEWTPITGAEEGQAYTGMRYQLQRHLPLSAPFEKTKRDLGVYNLAYNGGLQKAFSKELNNPDRRIVVDPTATGLARTAELPSLRRNVAPAI